jgi:uncharacterized protein with PIN domain
MSDAVDSLYNDPADAATVDEFMVSEINRLTAEVAQANKRTATLLHHVGDPARCKGCNKPIYWVRHKHTDKATPYDLDGANHFITCPKAADFKR